MELQRGAPTWSSNVGFQHGAQCRISTWASNVEFPCGQYEVPVRFPHGVFCCGVLKMCGSIWNSSVEPMGSKCGMPLLTPVGLPCAAPNVKLQCETPVLTPVWASAELHAAGIHCGAPLGGGSIGRSTMEFQWGAPVLTPMRSPSVELQSGPPLWSPSVMLQHGAQMRSSTGAPRAPP